MTSERPIINSESLGNPPENAVAAIVSEDQELENVTALMALGLTADSIEILKGEEGRAVLDLNGHHHGASGHLKRFVQGLLGSSQNEAINYDAALADGKVVIAVAVTNDDAMNAVTETFTSFGGDRINYFGESGMEQL